MNPLDARESEETYEYPARPYTLPMRPVQRFKVLSTSGDQPVSMWTPQLEALRNEIEDAWSDKYLTAEDARVLRQDGV